MKCTCRCGCDATGLPCGCCDGIEVRTPLPISNRPDLPALQHRFGRHGDVLASLLARLSSPELPALRELRTRARDDWTIALLDGWATVADVLSFYSERIANEGYLRTARERRSVVELVRLIGYEPRPGVAAGVHLAYTLDPGHRTVIPAGTRSRSVPGPGEQPQTFETMDALAARAMLNRLGPRLTRPQLVSMKADPVHLQGTGLNLAAGDALLFRLAPKDAPGVRFVAGVAEDLARSVTTVSFRSPPRPPRLVQPTNIGTLALALSGAKATAAGTDVLGAPTVLMTNQPPAQTFPHGGTAGDSWVRTLEAIEPSLAGALTGAWATADVTPRLTAQVWVLRTRAPLFGHNAPPRLVDLADGVPQFGEWAVIESEQVFEHELRVSLDQPAAKASAGDWAVVDYSGVDPDSPLLPETGSGDEPPPPLVTTIERVDTSVSRKTYGMSGTTTRLTLADRWINIEDNESDDFTIIRGTVVHTGAEELTLAEEPIDDPIAGDVLELDAYYDGIAPGRLLVVAGERLDLPGTNGVTAAEVARVAAVAHAAAPSEKLERPGDPLHTYLRLSRPLRHWYRRAGATIHGNVVHATHGETRVEVLGSGDASVPLQRFGLRQSPLTHVSAPTPSGITGTLETRVDDVRWPLVGSLAELGPVDRGYTTTVDAGGAVAMVFGDGEHGARLPTGIENVRARYRQGIGKDANVAAGAITILATKPLGVKDVVNPVPATGGAGPDATDHVKEAAPLPLKALDRLVSLADYGDFARTFAGIGKAAAAHVIDRGRRVVAVTVAGVDDIAVDEASDLVANLRRALRRWGDPDLPVVVLVRQLLLAKLRIIVGIHPDHDWAVVEPAVRAELAMTLGFDARALGQDLTESEVLVAVHRVRGVTRAHIDAITALRYDAGTIVELEPLVVPGPPPAPYHPGRRVMAEEIRSVGGRAAPAQLLYLSGAVPELLVLDRETMS